MDDEKVIVKKKNSNTGIVLIVSILLALICGMFGAYLISQTVSVPSVVKNITTSELVENSISSSVDKVYNSTVVIIGFSNSPLSLQSYNDFSNLKIF